MNRKRARDEGDDDSHSAAPAESTPVSVPLASEHKARNPADIAAEDEHADGSQDGEAGPSFACKLDSTDVLTTLLNTMQLDKEQAVTCEVVPAGLKFSVEKSKVLKAKAYVKESVFQEFNLKTTSPDEKVEFSVSLSILLHCLQVFGQSSHMQLSYAGHGTALNLILEDEGVITQCEIMTLEGAGGVEFNFRNAPLTSRAVIKSSFLKDSFAELDVPGGTNMSIHMSPRTPFLSMFVSGDSTSCKVDFPQEQEAAVFVEFECKQESKHSYPLSLIRPCMKALAKAEHTNLRMNEEGMLSMQHVIPSPDGASTSWVEFLVCANKEDE